MSLLTSGVIQASIQFSGSGAGLTSIPRTCLETAPANTIVITDSSGVLTQTSLLSMSYGGTGASSFTAYAPLCGGTTSTSPLQPCVGMGVVDRGLISAGSSSLPSFQGMAGINNMFLRTFTSSTTYTPSTGMKYCLVEMVAGGGGGGGAQAYTNFMSAGAGGGAGAYARSLFTYAEANGQAITIGLGGAGGTSAGTKGSTGGTSQFGTYFTLTGGVGGNGDPWIASRDLKWFQSRGGVGGSVSSGSGNMISMGGATGGSGSVTWSNIADVNQYWASAGGAGASTLLGNGGINNDAGAGSAGTGWGSGGSGALSVDGSTGYAGGSGRPGICVILEFCDSSS
jgi:hypothetical protein